MNIGPFSQFVGAKSVFRVFFPIPSLGFGGLRTLSLSVDFDMFIRNQFLIRGLSIGGSRGPWNGRIYGARTRKQETQRQRMRGGVMVRRTSIEFQERNSTVNLGFTATERP